MSSPWTESQGEDICHTELIASDGNRPLDKDHGPENLAAIKLHVWGLVKRSTPPASTP